MGAQGEAMSERRVVVRGLVPFFHSIRERVRAGVPRGMESFVASPGRAKGLVHDLGASFERVNRAFFGGAMTRPALSWSRIPSRRLHAQYRPGSDEIVFSVALDDERVPEVVVDFLMYHEALHRWQGGRFSGTRRSVHTPEFREEERRFPRFEEARAFLASFSAGRPT